MQGSLPQRFHIGTGELPSLVDRVLDERHPLKIKDSELDQPLPTTDPFERFKELIRKAKP
jgi:hypothetical protein